MPNPVTPDRPERTLDDVVLDATVTAADLINDRLPDATRAKLRDLIREAHNLGVHAAWDEVQELITEHRP